MQQTFTTFVGKSVRRLAKLRGGGSALPGLFAETIDPGFIKRTLSSLPSGIVIVTGTNGKTTTTKLAVELLEGQGMRVFTNRTGSNFTRGIAAALLGEIDNRGRLDADIAVLELDEAYAVRFVQTIKPDYCLLLNVSRDQLDRFGEIDQVANLLRKVASATTRGIVINRDDPYLYSQKTLGSLAIPFRTFSVAASLKDLFPTDSAIHGDDSEVGSLKLSDSDDTILTKLTEDTATFEFDGATHSTKILLKGAYNVQNATGAIAITRMIMGDNLDNAKLMESLASVTPAFGRGETISIYDQTCEIVLVKNPNGFQSALKSFPVTNQATMLAINDQYADGRDVSWLWDVDFSSLSKSGVAMVSGVRAYDMALRLSYDQIEIDNVSPDIISALKQLLRDHKSKPLRIFCTYTAMLQIRHQLTKLAKAKATR
ncbi:MAG: MurT ligase domain-containing protein [Candidatus Saccharimonas sp.]